MSWFRRGRDRAETDPVTWVDPRDDGGQATDRDDAAPSPGADPARADRSQGPWDVSEVGSADGFVDLGALWLPPQDGMELRLEVEESTGRVLSATAQIGGSAVQLQAFAAPRSAGIWDEIREEIATSITGQGGEADRSQGPFGAELQAKVPVRTPDGRAAVQPARFAGIDGPRWFLRAVFHGPAAVSELEAQPLEALVRGAVVVRGEEAMAPRELLTLTVPGHEAAPAPQPEDDSGPLRHLRPGPQITEVR